ncbi:MAG TPA: alpha/beta fold hydrolase [Verrucomicrobiae bacterium]|nr:alpha/beta fold hydrolase [Verrucomicrobiae bacterium]
MAAPDWLDRVAYPFTSRWLDLPSGRLHYIDEGQGRPVVMVHGTPDWSFLWRHLVKALAPRYRCLALDNLGFGLSDRPPGSWYLPEHQAANLKMLIERLGLRDLTLVLHDFGGPFGLHYALDKPDNVHSLVLMNTWMWSLADDRRVARVARLAGSRLGRYLYLEWNLSARLIMKRAFGDPARLPPSVHAQYLAPFPDPASRAATWAYARALWGSREWFDRLWKRRERLRDLPVLILWGMKDPAVREPELVRLQSAFTRPEVVRLPDVGHFPPEEAPDRLAMLIGGFLERDGR